MESLWRLVGPIKQVSPFRAPPLVTARAPLYLCSPVWNKLCPGARVSIRRRGLVTGRNIIPPQKENQSVLRLANYRSKGCAWFRLVPRLLSKILNSSVGLVTKGCSYENPVVLGGYS